MSKTLIFHASTEENIKAILKDGFKNCQKTWECSEDDYIYFYELEAMANAECLDIDNEDEREEAINTCIRRAFENAQITASVNKYTGNNLQCIMLEIDKDYIERDSSCDYSGCDMHSMGAIQVDVETINTVSQVVEVFTSDSYLPALMGAYISGFLHRCEVSLNLDKWNEREIEMLKQLDFTELLEELLMIDWY